MSIETRLRDALQSGAAAVTPTEAAPYARVTAAVARSRRRRRAVGAAAVAAVVAIAVGVPTVTGRLGDDARPAGQHRLPASTDPVWRSLDRWPVRGNLANDSALVEDVEAALGGHAVLVEDFPETRMAVVATSSDQFTLATGPRGGAAAQLKPEAEGIPTSWLGGAPVVVLATNSAYTILTSPAQRVAEVSLRPAISLAGTVTHDWAEVPLRDGFARGRATGLTRYRVGDYAGGPLFLAGRGGTATFGLRCQGDDCAEPGTEEQSAILSAMFGIPASEIDTRTVFEKGVPNLVMGQLLGEAPDLSASTLRVTDSTLPGGQVLRWATIGTGSTTGGAQSFLPVQQALPIDARAAMSTPVILSGSSGPDAPPTTLYVAVPLTGSVRAVSPNPDLWPSSELVPLEDGVALVELDVAPSTLEGFSVEVLDGSGRVLGTHPVAPAGDPYEVTAETP